MFKTMMATTVSSSSRDKEKFRRDEREKLLNTLLGAVKQCQIRFGGRSELATESDKHVSNLCKALESVFQHGLKMKQNTDGTLCGIINTFGALERISFWNFVKDHLTKHEQERYLTLKRVNTDGGRGRAWLRSSLNERSLSRYLNSMLSDTNHMKLYYHEWSLLMDQELNSTLPTMAAGLSPILFAIGIDDAKLNDGRQYEEFNISRSEPILTTPYEEVGVSHHVQKRKKALPAHVISFDNDADDFSSSDSTSVQGTSIQSASYLCSPDPIPSPSSSNDSSFLENTDITSQLKKEESQESKHTLTPVCDVNIGELIPVSVTSDDNNSPSQSSSLVENENVFKDDAALEQVNENINVLKIQMKQQVEKHKNEMLKVESRLLALTRENDVLKHQLKKYVGAVKMLNRDGLAHEALACLEASKEMLQEREESAQYQQKLVQVAEMHAELMEFNDRLLKQLLNKEDIINRLERELTDLRGPLPNSSNYYDYDDGVSIPESLVNIWIPSAFLTGGSTDVHHVYQIYVRIRDVEWNVYRRYAQFYSLHKLLKKEYSVLSTFDFPPKKTLGNKDSKFVEDRRVRLQRYLRQVIDTLSKCRSDLSDPASLVATLPFLGQGLMKEESKKKSSRKNFTRRKKESNAPDPSQYNGL